MVICERVWELQQAGGNIKPFTIRVHAPIPHEGEADCKIEVGEESFLLRGIDSWQAVQIAMQFARKIVAHQEEAGASFFWKSGAPAGSTAL